MLVVIPLVLSLLAHGGRAAPVTTIKPCAPGETALCAPSNSCSIKGMFLVHSPKIIQLNLRNSRSLPWPRYIPVILCQAV